MRKLFILLFTLTIGNASFADQLDGLAILDFLIYVLLIGAICIVVLFFSTIFRFARKEYKVSIPLNFSASVLILCVLISMVNLGSSIDPGFLAFCIGITIISILLIILNYRIGLKNTKGKHKD
ncbi:hypothetical protein D3C86_1694400 [compost metagenome]